MRNVGGGFQIDVAGHTQLDGGAIASTATPDKNQFSTGSLGYTDLKNEAEYKATSVSVSVSGGSGGGSGSGGFSQQNDKASSVTKAGIADGTLVVKDGSGTGISRGTSELQQDGLEAIFDVQKVAEQMEMGQVAGQVAFTAIGDLARSQTRDYKRAEMTKEAAEKALETETDPTRIAALEQTVAQANSTMSANQAQYDLWKDGGTGKTISHAVAGALSAGLGGGSALDGALGAAAAELARPLTAEENKLVQDLVSLGIGGAVGGPSGAGTALAGEVFNRQLHPDESQWIREHAEEFAAQLYGCAQACTPAQIQDAQNRLTVEAGARVDGVMADRAGGVDEAAQLFINTHPVEFSWGQGFTATKDQYLDFNYFTDLLSKDKQALTDLATALDSVGWSKREFQNAYHDVLLAAATQARGETGQAIIENFTGDVGLVVGVVRKLIAGDNSGATTDLVLSAAPWGISKVLRPIASAGDNLLWVNGRTISEAWMNTKGELTWINPISGAREVVPDAARLEVDHILPQDAIKKISGFDSLPAGMQKELLNDPANLQPMIKPANCSKGCKVEGADGGWKEWNGQPVSAEYKEYLQQSQEAFRKKVNEAVEAYNASRGR